MSLRYSSLVLLVAMPVLLRDFFRPSQQYPVGFLGKLRLALRVRRNTSRIATASSFVEHLVMAAAILGIPKSAQGCLVECGSYKGGSTTNLSLVAELCGRRLEVFDSFSGLPEPSQRDRNHRLPHQAEIHTYAGGAFCGTLEEVRGNVARYGAPGVCNFHPGYFRDTLPQFGQSCVFAFLDVDLRDSLETCLLHLWPLLADGAYLFVHEAAHLEIASLFFDDGWWQRHLRCRAPGLIGAGTGLGLHPASGSFRSALGYTIKGNQSFKTIPQ